MAPIKFDRIVSVSSEDPAYPAENLLKNAYSDKKWKCKSPGEKIISVTIQLEKSEQIKAVDVGNYGSAFVEVLVGKSTSPDDFKVLVVTSTLMTLQEAKLGNNLTSVRFFKEDNICQDVASEKWDRIKLVCSQPYNKLIQYGLSFVVVHNSSSSDVKKDSPGPMLGNFLIKEKTDIKESFSLFSKRKEKPAAEVSGAAAIRAASTSGIIEKKKPLINTGDSSENNEETPKQQKNETVKTKKEDGSSKKKEKKLEDTQSDESAALRKKTPKVARPPAASPRDRPPQPANGRTSKDVEKKWKPRLEKPFGKLLEGVTFTISGFQNPYRSELRSKALQMGAKYRPDWDSACTHLLCAFPNTPKFNQVLGHGKIVTKEWIEQCYRRRMRLPWRRHALHKPDKTAPESEEEIYEKTERPASPVDNRRRLSPGPTSSEEEDTDEEVERVLQRQRMLADKNKAITSDDSQINGEEEEPQPKKIKKDDESQNVSVKDSPFSKNSERKKAKKPEVEEESGTPSRPSKNSLIDEVKLTSIKTKEPKNGVVYPSTSKESVIADDSAECKAIKKPEKKLNDKESRSPKPNKKRDHSNESSPIPKKKPKPVSEAKEGGSVSDKKAKRRPPPDSKIPENPCDVETEVEDELSDAKLFNLPHLPTFFEDLNFLIGFDLNDETFREVRRYIIAHKGTITHEIESRGIDYFISNSEEEAAKVKKKHPSVIAVRPDWVWRAHDEDRIPPTTKFRI